MYRGHSHIAECLVKASCDVNATDDVEGNSPLILAAGVGADSVIEVSACSVCLCVCFSLRSVSVSVNERT